MGLFRNHGFGVPASTDYSALGHTAVESLFFLESPD